MHELLQMEPEKFLSQVTTYYENNKIKLSDTYQYFQKYESKAIPFENRKRLRSLRYRADWIGGKPGRTYNQFQEDIKRHTNKETCLIRRLGEDLENRGHSFSYKDVGVDNTGEVLLDGDFIAPDFEITIDDDRFLVDMKNTPVAHKATLKIEEINKALKRNAAIALFIDTGDLVENENATFDDFFDFYLSRRNIQWTIFGEKTLKSLKTIHSRRYKEVGGSKPAIQIGDRSQNGSLPLEEIPFETVFKVYKYGELDRFEGVDNRSIDFQGK